MSFDLAMSAPHVSILIPTYNRANYLGETIASALAQSYPEIEIIVIDDGSTDGTAEIVDEIKDGRVRYIYQENRGVSGALNTGWRAARGRFVAMLGSDDEMLPHHVETLLQLIERDEALSVVYGRAQGMDENGRKLPQVLGGPLKFPVDPLASLLYANSVCSIASLARRSVLEEAGGFDSNLRANEDWDLWIRLAEHWGFRYHDDILARYRMHSTSLTASQSRDYENIALSRIALIEGYYTREHIPDSAKGVRSAALRNVYLDAMIRYLTVGKRRAAFSFFVRGLGTGGNPFATTLRMGLVTIFDLYLSKTRWGVRLADALVARQRSS